MKQALFWTVGIAILLLVALYLLVFSQQSEIKTIISTQDTDLAGEQVVVPVDLSIKTVPTLSTESSEWSTYISSDALVSFRYPPEFTVKEENNECEYCPEIVFEHGDERLWFGKVPPGSENHCETLLQHSELVVEDMQTVIWYEYINTDSEDCSQAGDIHGFKATTEVGTAIYYLDYLPHFQDSINPEQLFVQMAKTIQVHQ